MANDLTVTRRENVGWITLDRRDGRNALTPLILREICEAVDGLIEDNSVRAIVIGAAGKHFSAGADFDFLDELTRSSALEIKNQIYGLFQGAARRIYHCPKPTIAAIQGAAVTVGCELALCCDFRIVSPSARFQESWIKLGIIPPLGGLYLLPRFVGMGRAAEIALSGRAILADEAVHIGLASQITDTEETLHEVAQDFAVSLANLPPLAYRAAKEAIHRGLYSTMENEWSANVLAQSLLLGSADFREGLAAAKERRAGNFAGK